MWMHTKLELNISFRLQVKKKNANWNSHIVSSSILQSNFSLHNSFLKSKATFFSNIS